MSLSRVDLVFIKELLDHTRHCGDYGLFYISKNLDEIVMILGDADEPLLEELEEYLEYNDNIKLVVKNEESLKSDNYLLISRGTIACETENLIDGEWIEDYNEEPQLLSLEEYAEFLKLYKSLPCQIN